MAKQNVYSVAQVNAYIKNMFTQDYMLRSILVKGEVSNCKYHSSGHIYFTLKDGRGTIACVMFAGNRNGLNFRLEQGQQIIAGGSVDIYERDGKYQLYVKQIELDGLGALYEKYEALKKELEERGMFAAEYKRSIPYYIKTLGIVTAPTGAAVRDIIQIALRRNPYVQIILYPAIVQGEQAPASIINGIHCLERQNVDVMIVGRGGGSIEDLWAFNEEAVAQAIFDSEIPVISAVGHETDTTIADFVADLRAPTPSAAAELAVCEISQLMDRIQDYEYHLLQKMRQQIKQRRSELSKLQMKLDYLSPLSQIREKRTLAMNLEEQLRYGMERCIRVKRHTLELYIERMKGCSPLGKLNQGFSYVSDKSGKTVHDIQQLELGDTVSVYLKNGHFDAKVMEKWEK